MKSTYVIHILTGILGLLSGYIALWASKGSPVHRRSGLVFVAVMLTTALAGMVMAVGRGVAPAINVPAGLLTIYLVVTALTTVKPPASGAKWLHSGGLVVALAVVVGNVILTAEGIANGGKRDGLPVFPFVMFGTVALIGVMGDLRVLRFGLPRGGARLARHLWRMSFALFIASLSFFIGQMKVFPEAMRIPGLLAMPLLAVLATMFYWLWRLRPKRAARSMVAVTILREV